MSKLAFLATAESVNLLGESSQHHVAASTSHLYYPFARLRELYELHAAIYKFIKFAVLYTELSCYCGTVFHWLLCV